MESENVLNRRITRSQTEKDERSEEVPWPEQESQRWLKDIQSSESESEDMDSADSNVSINGSAWGGASSLQYQQLATPTKARRGSSQAPPARPRKLQRRRNNEDSDDDDNNEGCPCGKHPFARTTRSFYSKYTSKCGLPCCHKRFVEGKTSIIGVSLLDPVQCIVYSGSRRFEKNNKDTPFWICSSHCPFTRPNLSKGTRTQEEEGEDKEEEEEDTDSNENLPHDLYDPAVRSALDQEIQRLRKNSFFDRRNTERYKTELSKHQLQIHTPSNRALRLSPVKRLKRNLSSARFDTGLKEERGIQRSDPEHGVAQVVFLKNGTKVKVFPNKKRRSKYEQKCALDFCEIQFVKDITNIVGAMIPDSSGQFRLNDLDKHFYICFDHVRAKLKKQKYGLQDLL